MSDTLSRFFLPGQESQHDTADSALDVLRNTWDGSQSRKDKPDREWTRDLESYLGHLVEMRILHVREWVSSNLARFKTSHENIEALRRSLESTIVDLKESVQICKMQCGSCHLLCIRSRHHEGSHDCQTTHSCVHGCDYSSEHPEEQRPCGFRYIAMFETYFFYLTRYFNSAGHPGRHMWVIWIYDGNSLTVFFSSQLRCQCPSVREAV